jgi:hypothetical protein
VEAADVSELIIIIIIIIMWVIRSKRLSHEQAHAWKAYTPLHPRSADPREEVVLPKPAEWLVKL